MNEQERARTRARDIGQRLNAMRQDWEIAIQTNPRYDAKVSELNALAGVVAELLYLLAYGEREGAHDD